MEALKSYGGVESLAFKLSSSPLLGIDQASQAAKQKEFGINRLPDKEGASFFALLVSLT
jgi:hypothetical protein